MGAPRGAAKPASKLARNGDLVRVSPHLPLNLVEALQERDHIELNGLTVKVSVSQHIAAACEQLLSDPPAKLPDEPIGPIKQWWLPIALVERLDVAYTPAGRERAMAAAVERYVRRMKKSRPRSDGAPVAFFLLTL